MRQLHHFGIRIDTHSKNRSGRFKTKREAEEVGNDLGLTAYQRIDGSWDLE